MTAEKVQIYTCVPNQGLHQTAAIAPPPASLRTSAGEARVGPKWNASSGARKGWQRRRSRVHLSAPARTMLCQLPEQGTNDLISPKVFATSIPPDTDKDHG